MRSADLGLGLPFNIASYALLTHMIAYITDLIPGELIIQLGDAHIYNDHLEALKDQAYSRLPVEEFPEMRWKRTREEVAGSEEEMRDMDGWKGEDLEIRGYRPMKGIKMNMSV